jgi:parvulin-like peptidyl-prolyl isomerase
MISFFRQHLRGRALRLIIYIVAFIIIFPSALTLIFRQADTPDWALRVNDYTVSVHEFNQRVHDFNQRILQQFGPQFAALFTEQHTKQLVTQTLITQKLLTDVARDLNIALSPSYVAQQLLETFPRDFVTANGSVDRALIAHMRGLTVEQFDTQFDDELKEHLVRSLAEGAVHVPIFALRDAFTQQFTDRTYRIATFSLDKAIKAEKKHAITNEDAKGYFDSENKKTKRYWVPEKRAGIVITFDAHKYGAKISDKQVQRYYDRNKHKEFVEAPAKMRVRRILLKCNDQTKLSVQERLEAIRKEITAEPTQSQGDLFAQKAREISDDLKTKKAGGLTDFFARSDGDESFTKAAFRLQQDGDVSPVFESADGFELIQRVERTPQVFKPLEQVRKHIEEMLRAQQFKKVFAHDVRRVLSTARGARDEEKKAEAAQAKRDALQEFAKIHGGTQDVISLTQKGSEPYMAKLFALHKGAGGTVFDGEKGIVVLVTDIQASYQPSFEHAKDEVLRDMYQVRARETLKNLMKNGVCVTSKEAFEHFAKEHGGSLSSTGWISKKTLHTQKTPLAKHEEAARALFALSAIGSVVPIESESEAMLGYLEDIKPFDEHAFNEHKGEIETQERSEQKMAVEQGFIASLFKNATIKVNDKIIQEYKTEY